MNEWIVIAQKKEGACDFAVNNVLETIKDICGKAFPLVWLEQIENKDLSSQNFIYIGGLDCPLAEEILKKGTLYTPIKKESYSVYVGESLFNNDKQMIAIIGYDEMGTVYGCMDFCNRYLGKELLKVSDHNVMFDKNFFLNLFDKPLNTWCVQESPAIPSRAIWTWGHVIYDYRRFLENMTRLRLNEIVIWNDFVPKNAREVVEYAHLLGIKVIWGFAWGWGLNCADEMQKFTSEGLSKLKENVLSVYESQYLQTFADGIYFQSFTELHTDKIGEKLIAEVVTDFVNEVAGELLNRHPALNIQFGLHATSVKTHLDYLKKLDKRVRIVWEDCGAFPYAYRGEFVENFDQTIELTRELMKLRGDDENFGAVLKGMVNLDWHNFKHATDSITIGESSSEFIKERQIEKNRLWKIVQANWIKNAEYARVIIEDVAKSGNDSVLQGLVEDGLFENEIPYSTALFADLLWDPRGNIDEIKETVAKYLCVKFANI